MLHSHSAEEQTSLRRSHMTSFGRNKSTTLEGLCNLRGQILHRSSRAGNGDSRRTSLVCVTSPRQRLRGEAVSRMIESKRHTA
jgi:hypothetical protein